MKKTEVIIIGAGAAGLMAGRILKAHQVDFMILESTNKLGGRAQTLKGKPHIEYGPEYLHGETPLTDSLMEEFSIPYYDLKFNYHLFLDGKLEAVPDFWEQISSVIGHIKKLRHDMPFDEYLKQHDHHSYITQELAKVFVEGFDAADLNRVSTKALKDMQEQVSDPKMRKLRRPLNGYGEIMLNLAEELLPYMYFRHRVDSIEWKPGQVTVKGCMGQDIYFNYEAKKIIDTVSIGVLKQQNLTPKPEELQKFLDRVEMGQVVKVVGELSPEFLHLFEDHAFPFISSPELSFAAWWAPTPIHMPLVTAWAGGERARQLTQLSQNEKEERFITELGLLTSQTPEKIKGWMKKIHHYNWNEDPSFLGAYSYPKVRETDENEAPASFEKTLYLAGEAFDPAMSGTIEGALVSGKKAAESILKDSSSK